MPLHPSSRYTDSGRRLIRSMGLIDGGLFTRDFLNEGILATPQWVALDAASVAQARQKAETLLASISSMKNPTEAVTEKDLIYPLLSAIGWGDLVFVQPNASAKGRSDVPDALLFADPAQLAKARAEPEDFKRFQHGLCQVEAKRWGRPLDREEKARKDEPGTPSSQMLRYLRRADDLTKGSLRWGILTNGRLWRLYFQGALSVAEDFLEIDLGKVLDLPGCPLDLLDRHPDGFADTAAWRDHAFRVFLALFTRTAFLPAEAGETFHALALREGKFWEARVAKSLSDTVFTSTFPMLADAIARADPKRPTVLAPAYLDEVRQGALILLYRLLFVLFAEDRNLLPDDSGNYRDVCLTQMRLKIAANKQRGIAPSASFGTYWSNLASIFRAISVGDDTLGIPPYNGGLFDPASAPVLERIQLPDTMMSQVIFGLSHQVGEDGRDASYINYRDLSVQQLGSVYERLLEYKLGEGEGGAVVVTLNPFGRKGSGSYYTPDELVQLIISRTLSPLVEEAVAAFQTAVAAKAGSDALLATDPAEALLNLKICDPAMGSGHFLVSLVDWLTDRVLETMAAGFLPPGYTSPLAARISDIRARIVAEARQHKWPIVEAQLNDKQIVKRMVLKRCVYGVDLNPMAVELAKVALWLHTFTVGAPLSFLDHHLICGNSLFGERVRPVMDWAFGGNLLINDLVQQARGAARGMAMIESLTDADIAEAKSSKASFEEVQAVTANLRGFMDVVHGLRWASGHGRIADRAAARLQRGEFGNPIALLRGEISAPEVSADQVMVIAKAETGPLSAQEKATLRDALERREVPGILARTRAALSRENFLHWEVAFPGVWTDWESTEPKGGFDALIGNPPWDRMKFQEVEWFSDRRPEIALATRAADRKRMVAALLAGESRWFTITRPPKRGRRARARWRAAMAIIRCCRAATQIFTACLSSGRWPWSSRKGLSACSRRRA